MASKFTELAIDCADPSGLARFWCSVLDYEVQDEDDGIVTIGSPMVAEGKNQEAAHRARPTSGRLPAVKKRGYRSPQHSQGPRRAATGT